MVVWLMHVGKRVLTEPKQSSQEAKAEPKRHKHLNTVSVKN